jgi:hypothetical protein
MASKRFSEQQIADANDGIEKFLSARGHSLKRQSGYLVGPCPVCGGDDRFVVNLKKKFFYCRGCKQGGDAISLVMRVNGVSFTEAVQLLANIADLSPPKDGLQQRVGSPRHERTKPVERWWGEARPIENSLAERYLHSRGIVALPNQHADSLRFHPRMVFGVDGDAWRFAPCLVALVRNPATNAVMGLQRVALTTDGRKLGLKDTKGRALDRMALGATFGGVVKLDPDANVAGGLCIAEGIETALAARCIEHKNTMLRPMWATLYADNLQRFPVLAGIGALTIVVDADENHRGQDAAAACATTWSAAGREVIRLTPRGWSS